MGNYVLVIEDEPNIVEAIRFILMRDGWDVSTLSDGGLGQRSGNRGLEQRWSRICALPSISAARLRMWCWRMAGGG